MKATLRRLKSENHGISNVLVVMLSLILVVVIAANVVLWSYQMNQFDWEKMQEKIEITEAYSTTPKWYYHDFSHRVQHNITASLTITDYQIKITIVNGTGASQGNIHHTTYISRSDFGDVRFTWYNSTSKQEQPIPYWCETIYNGKNATFWVKIPAIPASPRTATIYIYYGKNDAETQSNGDSTFIFFDDFDDEAINQNKWTNINDAVESGGSLRGNGGTRKVWMQTLQTFQAPIAVVFKMRGEVLGDFDSGIQVGNLYFISDRGTSNPIIGTGWVFPSGSAGDVVSWHIYEARILASSQVFYDLTANRYATAAYSYEAGSLYLIGDSNSANRDTFYDYIFVRRYIDPEPAHGAWGREEAYDVEMVYGRLTVKVRNISALTTHIVAVWVNNATLHMRYTVNVFINPGESATFSIVDKSLPINIRIVKVISERGNTALFISD
ncbi:MAG: DUF2341 domain-containing protein [Candidatus Bathyarchaeota archaeon]|nr:DUF2341 domain-containing protein [Candidatus Bathyarchaeota archaeon]MDW8039846.1 DUF2341 domain-containing protein [Nitrososphaerota archaeon]